MLSFFINFSDINNWMIILRSERTDGMYTSLQNSKSRVKYTEFSRNIYSIASGIGVNNTSYLNFISWSTFCRSMYWIADNYVWTELRGKWQVTSSDSFKNQWKWQVIAWDVTCIVTAEVGNMFHFNILHSYFLKYTIWIEMSSPYFVWWCSWTEFSC